MNELEKMNKTKTKILIVDDSLTMRTIIKREFDDNEFETREAANGVAALDIIKKDFIPDMITLDIDMPKLNGFDTCERLYSDEFSGYFSHLKDNRVPIIFVTSSDNLKDRKRGFELGATDFITKPFEEGDILKLVSKTLHPNNRLNGITALLVDDSRSARMVVGNGLSMEGITVLEAEDGNRAFEIMCNKMSQIDIVISDIEMPGMSGGELCVKIRKELGMIDLPIIFFTGIADRGKLLEVFQAGGTDYLVKPFIKEEMIARILVHIEKTQLNKRLRKSVTDLRENMRIMNDMIAVLSHDMRTPLNGIVGFSNLLMSKGHLHPEDKENLVLIKESGKMLLSLINDILDLSKIKAERDKLDMKPVAVFDIIRKSVKALSNLADLKNQEINLENKVTHSMILGNHDALMRVINNLLGNSIKFTPEDGDISITIAPGKTGYINVTVKDSGIGIPDDKIPYLFDQYSRISQDGTAGEKGTGLGMSIIKEIIEMHNGEINVTSRVGHGTTFVISLPQPEGIENETYEQNEETPESKQEEVLKKIKGVNVLLAEDNPVNQKIAQIILSKLGCTVTKAGDGLEAIEKYLKNPDKYNVVFMDMEMPEMDGIEATKKIRDEGYYNVPIIAMTASTRDSDMKRCMKAGMNGFITKPISHDAILKALDRAIKS